MGRLERYVHEVSKNIDLSHAEKEEFKSEIRQHLSEAVKELREQGKSEEESVAIALRRFGTEKIVNRELRTVIRSRRPWGMSLLRAAGLCLILSLLFMACWVVLDYENRTDFDRMQAQFHRQISDPIAAGRSIPDGDVESFFRENKRILRFVSLEKTDSQSRTTAEYRYPADVPETELTREPIIPYPIPAGAGGEKWEAKVALNGQALFSKVPHVLSAMAAVFFTAYWMLFAWWSTRGAYRTGRLNALWLILFFTLNVPAYLLYIAKDKLLTKRWKVSV